MGTAILWPLTQSVADALNSGSFSITFEAERKVRPRETLENLATLKTTCVPRGKARELLVRGYDRVEPQVDVGIQQQVEPGDDERIEELFALLEEIEAFLVGKTLVVNGVKLSCYRAEVSMVDADQLDKSGVFTGVVTATFRGEDKR